jgi:2'-5' RNA ligase
LKRAFIAIDIPLEPGIIEQINKLKSDFINEKIKWVKPYHYHITLQFLGNVENSDIQHINESLDEVSCNFSGFSLELTEFGVFKNLGNPRVLWIGFRTCEELAKLKNAVENEMNRFGFEKSNKAFSPHLTIARIKMIKQVEKLKQLIDTYKGRILQVIDVNEIILYESILRQEGPEYKVIKRHSLRKD